MKCCKCNREATRRLSPDLDIAGIPVCDSKECENKIRYELLIKIFEGLDEKKN